MQTYFQTVQNINITGRISKSEFQYTLQSSDTEALYAVAPGAARQDRRDRRPARRHHRSLHQEPADGDRDRSLGGGRLWHLGRSDPPGAVQLLRHAPGRDDLHRVGRLSGDPGMQSGIPGRPQRPVEDFPEDQSERSRQQQRGRHRAGRRHQRQRRCHRPGHPAQRGDEADAHRRPAAGQSPGPAAGGDDLLQPRARLLARSGDRRHHADRARRQPAGIDHHRLPGRGAGLPGFAQGTGRAGAGGDLRGLCGARHPVRELHPPDHDHLRPAVGRRRRAAHADAVPDGPVGHRDDRHRHAGRHREEERHHDDRLRDRATPRRARRGSRDPRSLPAALPARS